MMEPTLVTIDAGKRRCRPAHEGESSGFVLEGEITIILGKREYRCKRAVLYYKCEEIHYITNQKRQIG